MNQSRDKAIDLAAETARRYRISTLEPLLASCRATAAQQGISVAVLGRFKAGKSSFLNHLFRRSIWAHIPKEPRKCYDRHDSGRVNVGPPR